MMSPKRVAGSALSGLASRPLVIWGVGVGVYLLAVFHRTSLGVAGPQAAERLGLSAGQLSTFVMLQLGVYAAMQVPTGILVDRFGPRRVVRGSSGARPSRPRPSRKGCADM